MCAPLAFYMITTAFAVTLGLVMGNLFSPGKGLELAGTASGLDEGLKRPSLVETLVEIVPENPFNAIVSGGMLPTIFFALLFGMGVAYLKESEDEERREAAGVVFKFFQGGAEVMYKVVGWILQYAPVGVFALIAVVFGKEGAQALGPLGLVALAVYCALVLHMALIYGGLLALFRVDPLRFFSKAKDATVTAFVTRSSGGTLPVSLNLAETRMGVSKGVYSFTLPLGATINMDGTAIYQGVCAVFIGFAIGSPLDFGQQSTVVATALLASIGTAGVPGAGAIMLLMVLNSVGLDVEPGTKVAMAYAMIFGIDALLDMGRTALNVTGDLAVTCAVAKTEGEMDENFWKAETPGTKAAKRA